MNNFDVISLTNEIDGAAFEVGSLLDELHIKARAAISRIVRIANGENNLASNAHLIRVEWKPAIVNFYTLNGAIELTSGFYEVGVGLAILRAEIRVGEVINQTEAAAIVSRSHDAGVRAIWRAVKKGDLRQWLEPDEPNPKHAVRYLKSEVEQFAHKRNGVD